MSVSVAALVAEAWRLEWPPATWLRACRRLTQAHPAAVAAGGGLLGARPSSLPRGFLLL